MDRRDFIKMAGLAGLAVVCPLGVTALAADPKYKGPYLISLHAGGGWDPTMVCDPKGGKLDGNGDFTADSVNHFTNTIDVGPFKAAPVNLEQDFGGEIIELYSAERFLTDHGGKLLVLNGVDTATNSHETGTRVIWSGRTNEGQPSIGALFAAFAGKDLDLPLAYSSFGGYDVTAGLVPIARAGGDVRVIQRIAYPNLINVENIGNDQDPPTGYFTNDTAARILAAQAERMKAMQEKETLPEQRKGQSALLLARSGAGSLSALAEELVNAPSATLNTAFPAEFGGLDDNAFGGDLRNLMEQALISILAFKTGVGVAANLSIGGFDTHDQHDNNQGRQLMKLLRGYDYVQKLIKDYGLEGKVVVVIGSDFGRTPFYNDGNGKDHWNVTSVLVSGPGVEGNRVVGATDDGFRPMRVDPNNVGTVLPDTDKAGSRIEPHHIHRELRRVVGLEGTDLDKAWGLPGDPLALFG